MRINICPIPQSIMMISSKPYKSKVNKLFLALVFILFSKFNMADNDITFKWDNVYTFSIFSGLSIGVYSYLYRYGISHLFIFKETLMGNYDSERANCYNLMKFHRGSRFFDMPNFYTVYEKTEKVSNKTDHRNNYYLFPVSLELMQLPPELDVKVHMATKRHYNEAYIIEKNKYTHKKSKKHRPFKKSKDFEKFSINWRANTQEIYAFCLSFYNDPVLFYQCAKSIYQNLPYKDYWNSIVVHRNQSSSSWPIYGSEFKGVAPVFYIDSDNNLLLERWIFVESTITPSCGLKLEYTTY